MSSNRSHDSLDDCILAEGYIDRGGYGRKTVEGKSRLAHRVAYCDAMGVPLGSIRGLVVRHRCDNPRCINPNHLVLGTQLDNIQDRVDRGRSYSPKGERNPKCKLSWELVSEIREEYSRGGVTQRVLSG